MGNRLRYDKQFKVDAVRLITENGRRATEVARDLGIHVNLLYLWKKQLEEDPLYSFPGHGKLKPAFEILRHFCMMRLMVVLVFLVPLVVILMILTVLVLRGFFLFFRAFG